MLELVQLSSAQLSLNPPPKGRAEQQVMQSRVVNKNKLQVTQNEKGERKRARERESEKESERDPR